MSKVQTKKWYESKTVWLNVITTAVGILTLLSESLPEEYTAVILTIIGALNVVLRVWFTNTAVTK
jgi:hypothetical protein